jgi:DNA-binding SARP family transcriptional activator/tetratricopeptide (TPR) repeat protein
MATPSPRRVFFLRTFGTLSLEGGADARQRSRRALALLALVAADGPTGANRDRVLAFLWPNSDAERAANSFRQILHGIRRDLGDETLIYESGRLRLNPSRFGVDLWDFNRTIRDGRIDVADAIYRGPFLDGFAINGLDEFERWADGERQRLHQAVVGAVRHAAVRATAEGRHHDSVTHWRRVTTLEPLSTTGALGLLNALAAVGDRAGALAYARVYQTLVRSQLEMEPDAEIGHFVDTLRVAGSGSVTAAAKKTGTPVQLRSTVRHVTMPAPASVHIDAAAVTPRIGRRSWRRAGSLRGITRLSAAAKIGIATGVALVLFGSARVYGRSARGVRQMPNVVAVMPLVSLTGIDTSLSRAMTELLATDVNGAGVLRAVVPASVTDVVRATTGGATSALDRQALHTIARRLGAGLLVTGEIGAAGSEARVTLSLRDGRDGSVIGRPVTVNGDTLNVLRLIDAAATQIVGERYQASSEHLIHAAARSAHSIEALKAFLRGEAALDSGRYVDAADEFKEATLSDSTFAIAYYRLAIAADWAERPELAQRATDLAIRFSDHLDDRDKRLMFAYAAWRGGRAAQAERAYRDLLTDYPDDSEVWFQLGEVLFHDNPLRGESVTDARPVFERFLALSPNSIEGIIHLARIAALEKRQQAADALERRAIRLVGDASVLESGAFRVFALGDRPGVKRVTRDLERAAPGSSGPGTLLDVAIDADDVAGAAVFARDLVDESTSPASKAFAWRLLAHTSLARRRWDDTKAQLDSATALDGLPSLVQLGEAAALPFILVPRFQLEEIRARLLNPVSQLDTAVSGESGAGSTLALARLHALGLLDVRLGDKEGARAIAITLDSYISPDATRRAGHTLAQSIRAHLAASELHLLEALADLDAADWEGPAHTFASEVGDRYFRATLLDDVGRTGEAAKWFASIAERAVYELPFLAPSQAALAEIDRKNGKTESARAHRRRVEALWGASEREANNERD